MPITTRRRRYKFTPAGQEVYDRVFKAAINKQVKIKHPATPVIDKEYWETICHNFAMMAAMVYEGYELDLSQT